MRVWGILGILLVLGAAVLYIDRSAVARVEGARVLKALANQKQNAETIAEVAALKQLAADERAQDLQARLDALPPPAPSTGEFCTAGCKPKWTAD